ncbi:Hemolymph lipopolysaccharide-binding protein [Blattella germanica]|nr:Hemolymph lipopolysaccharide-binding protein [Blattella germanica]
MGYDIPNFNFSILSRHNETGSWYADVQLAHEEKHIWDVYVDHTTTVWNGSKSIVIDAKIVFYNWRNTTWHQAVKVCEEEGGYLLVTKSKDETREILPLVKQLWSEWFFVGTHDNYQEGVYVTVQNDTLQSTGFPWWPGEPDDNTGWNCGCFQLADTEKFGLSDCLCMATLPFICKKEIIQ